ncbi:MAG: substrate-binding domain-containing protein [Clostridia bacterium]
MPVLVFSTLALKGTLEKLRADFERAVPGLQVRFDATQAILASLREGAKADVLILTAEAIETLQSEGRVRDARKLGSSGVGVAVRAGALRPDISTLESFKNALLSAQSVAHSKVGASGLYFSSLLKEMGMENRLKKRVVVEKGPVGLAVARGEAELGIQQLCELAPVPGIDIIGGLPEPLQKLTWFSAGISVDASDRAAAATFMQMLEKETTRAAMRTSRIDPP